MPLFPQQERFNAQIDHVIDVFVESECAIRPHAIITGPSGSGKSFLVNKIAKRRRR